MMKKLLGPIVVSAATVLLLIACRGDVILEPPPSLVGNYVGTYTWQIGQGSEAESEVQSVKFRFGETTWNMDIDTSAVDFNDQICFCNAYGSYAVTDRVRLELGTDAPLPPPFCQACDPTQSPQGLYALEQPSGGIKLIWIQTLDVGGQSEIVTSQLILTRVTE